MLISILFSSLLFLNQPTVGVSKGERATIPSDFVSLDEVERLEIRKSYWAKVDIKFSEDGNYVLQAGKPNLKAVSFYSENGDFLKEGNHISFSSERQESKTLYLFYPFTDEKDKGLLSIKLYSEIGFITENNKINSRQLIFHAMLSFPLLVAFFFSIFTKQKVYAYYACYILSIMLFFGYQYGLLGSVFNPINNIAPMWIWLFSFLNTLFYLLFSSSFLELKKVDMTAFRLIKTANYFIFFFFLLSCFLYVLKYDVQHSLAYKLPFWIFQIFLIIWFIIRIFKHPYKIKSYYLTGFFILFIVSISGQFLSVSQSASSFNFLFQIGLVVEVFILALGLGARVYEMQKAEIKAQNDLINQLQLTEKIQKEYAEKLEARVATRTEKLSQRNKEYEILLREVHHRVKNNLQMIISLLNMQHRRIRSTKTDQVFVSTKNKIKTLSMIHEHLYQNEDLESISLKNYVSHLCKMLVTSFHRGNKIDLEVDIQSVETEIDLGISIGLIVNELVTNTLKYGIAELEKPEINVSINEENDSLKLIVTDNGEGLDESNADFGLGYTIIKSIIASHNGTLKFIKSTDYFTIEIDLIKHK